jgi:hypothetical protein
MSPSVQSTVRCIIYLQLRTSDPRPTATGSMGTRLVRQTQTGPMPFLGAGVSQFHFADLFVLGVPCLMLKLGLMFLFLFLPIREVTMHGPNTQPPSDGEPHHHKCRNIETVPPCIH